MDSASTHDTALKYVPSETTSFTAAVLSLSGYANLARNVFLVAHTALAILYYIFYKQLRSNAPSCMVTTHKSRRKYRNKDRGVTYTTEDESTFLTYRCATFRSMRLSAGWGGTLVRK